MYTEEYEHRGFPFRDFLLKLILIIIFVFLLVWLLPKFISPTVVNKGNSTTDISPLTSQIFADNLERMKEAAISYYTDERLPKEVGDSDTMTLSDMIGQKLIVALIDKNNKACDVEKSYVKITKLDEEYLLKVNLKDSEKEDYILVHLGCYTYCDSYICEKQPTNVAIKGSKPTDKTPIKKPDGDKKPGDKPSPEEPTDKPTDTPEPTDNPEPTNIPEPTDSPEPTSPPPTNKPGYIYEYTKTTGIEMSKWTPWSAWSKTNCNTATINCNDSSPSCLKKLQRYNRKEKIGTYQKKYSKTRDVLVQTGSYKQKACSKYNYVIVNTTTYATTTTTTYTTINTITETTMGSRGGWKYNGRGSYKNPPRDTSTTHYIFVGADYSYCNETCTTLPNYWYDSYTYTGGMSTVTSTTSTPGGSSSDSSTDGSGSSSVTAECGSYVTKTVPIYGTIRKTELATRTEPLYGTVCYQSTKTRRVVDSGKVMFKWSKYNDQNLLNNGWKYTGRKKQDK